MPWRVRASSETSSSASDWGTTREGSRVRAISAAVLVSRAIGAIARRAIIMPANSATPGSDEHADEQEELDARDGRLGVGDAAPVLDVHLADSFAGAGDVDVGRVAEHAVAVDVAGLERGGAEGRRFGGFGDHGAAEREDPDHRRALGLGEVLERRVDADDLETCWG